MDERTKKVLERCDEIDKLNLSAEKKLALRIVAIINIYHMSYEEMIQFLKEDGNTR